MSIRVEIVRAWPHRNESMRLELPEGASVADALAASGWNDGDCAGVAVFGLRATPAQTYDVVGPICESGDFLARERLLAVEEGDLLAILSAGAYGMTMSSNYNTRPRAAEIIVDGEQAHLVRARETIDALFADERPL